MTKPKILLFMLDNHVIGAYLKNPSNSTITQLHQLGFYTEALRDDLPVYAEYLRGFRLINTYKLRQ